MLVALAAACFAGATAATASASVWTIGGLQKAYPSSLPGRARTISLSLAGNEWRGAQIVIRGAATRRVTFSWAAGSDSLLTQNSTLQLVGYVHITRPTSYVGSKAGWYPDPLLPAGFDRSLTVPRQTTPFYVLFHVPYGTPEGEYSGVISVDEAGTVTPVAVHVHVWPFGWQKLSLSATTDLNIVSLRASLGSKVKWSNAIGNTLLAHTYGMFADHGIEPGWLPSAPRVNTTTGHADWQSYIDSVTPYVGSSGVFNDTRLPFLNFFPWHTADVFRHTSAALTYLKELAQVCKQQGWTKSAYVYNIDEPTTVAAGKQVERMAVLVHKASAAAGFRMRYLITDDPRSHAYLKLPANSYLFNDIDIWCPRYYYFFGRLADIQARQRAGATIWWYLYANAAAKRIPTWVIDKSLVDERVMGWLSYEFNVSGILYFSANRWVSATGGNGYRDPYRNPMSAYDPRTRTNNGDGTLIYPGYEPSLGLTDPLAAPRSSLRFEAIRDGLEDYQYLRLASMTGGSSGALTVKTRVGDRFARAVAAGIATFTINPKLHWNNQFPIYSSSTTVYDAAKQLLGNRISRYLHGLAPVVATGNVVNARTGKPIAGALVTDGILKTHTGTNGTFTLSDVQPVSTIRVSVAKYKTKYVTVRDGSGPTQIKLTPA